MEISPFLALCAVRDQRKFPGKISIITARFREMPLTVLITGPGMVNTAMALGSYLSHHRPWLIIQTGIAGFFRGTGLSMGGIGIATAEIDIHCGVEKTKGNHGLHPLPFSLTGSPMEGCNGQVAMHPGLVRTARAIIRDAFSSEQSLPGRNIFTNDTKNDVDASSGRSMPGTRSGSTCHPPVCPVVSGPFITVSTLTARQETVARLAQTYTPVMEAMEGAAAAQVACRYGMPFLEIRSGSNPVGVRDRTGWHIPLAVERLSMALAALIDKGGLLCTAIPHPKRN